VVVFLLLIFSDSTLVELFLPGLLRESLAARCSAIFLSTFFATDFGSEGLRSVFAGDVLPEAGLGATLVCDYLVADLALEIFLSALAANGFDWVLGGDFASTLATRDFFAIYFSKTFAEALATAFLTSWGRSLETDFLGDLVLTGD
jgi:hypothetical protein